MTPPPPPPTDGLTAAANGLHEAQAAVVKVADLLDQATAQLGELLAGPEVSGSHE